MCGAELLRIGVRESYTAVPKNLMTKLLSKNDSSCVMRICGLIGLHMYRGNSGVYIGVPLLGGNYQMPFMIFEILEMRIRELLQAQPDPRTKTLFKVLGLSIYSGGSSDTAYVRFNIQPIHGGSQERTSTVISLPDKVLVSLFCNHPIAMNLENLEGSGSESGVTPIDFEV